MQHLQVQIADTKEILYLASQPFARGGEGLLYEVRAPKAYKGLIVKLYYQEKRTLLREQKLNYLSLNFPDFAAKTEADNFFMLAWPLTKYFCKWQFCLIFNAKGGRKITGDALYAKTAKRQRGGMSRMQQRKRAEKEKYEQELAQLRLDFIHKEKALTAAFEQYEQAQESAKKEAVAEYILLCSEFEQIEKTSAEQMENAYFALCQKIETATSDVLRKWTNSFG